MKRYFFVLALALCTWGWSQNYIPVATYSPVKIKTFQDLLETRNDNLGNVPGFRSGL